MSQKKLVKRMFVHKLADKKVMFMAQNKKTPEK